MKRVGRGIAAIVSTCALPAAMISTVAGITIPFRRRTVKHSRSARWMDTLYGTPVHSITGTAREHLGKGDYRADFAGNLQAVKRGSVELAGSLAETARTDLPPIVRDASGLASEIAGELGTKGRAVASGISERVHTDLAPAAKTLGKDALEGAEDALDTVRERATDLAKTARKEYVPLVSARAEKLGRVIVPTSAGTVGTLTTRVKHTLGLSRPSKSERIRQHVTSRVSGAVHEAGSQTKHAAAETTMIFAWGTGLGLVVYYGVLTPEQRERLTGFVSGAYEQAREAIRDFRDD